MTAPPLLLKFNTEAGISPTALNRLPFGTERVTFWPSTPNPELQQATAPSAFTPHPTAWPPLICTKRSDVGRMGAVS